MNETPQKRIKQHCCGGLRYTPSHHKNAIEGKCEDSPPTHTLHRRRSIRERTNTDTLFASAPTPTAPPARTSADRRPPRLFLPKTYALRHRTLCVAAHTRGLTHTHNILYETSQKRIRKNCRGGFSPSTARVAQTHQCGGRRPRTANKKRAEARRARGAGRGRRGGRGSPPPHPAPAPPRCEHGAEEDQGASRRVPHLDRRD